MYIYMCYICYHATVCCPGYHHNCFVASHVLGHMMYYSHLDSVRSEDSVSHDHL